MNELDDILERHELEDRGLLTIRRPYKLCGRTDNFNKWDDVEFFNRFRFSKPTVIYILKLVEDSIIHRSDKNHAVSPLQQLLITLRFYACGSFQIVMGDFGGVHQTTAGKIINRVTNALIILRRQFINMPSTEIEKSVIKEQFFKIAKFPRVLGAVDGTHIPIQSPGGVNAETFRNRKGVFSLNVQVVCDATSLIRDIVCRWPGSCHDSHIFNNSTIKMKFQNGEMDNGVLLGDSAYPLSNYLITPINSPKNKTEALFNECQIKTRLTVERTFGIWKRRFPILSLGLRNNIKNCQDIIIAIAILHNIATTKKEKVDSEEHLELQDSFIYLNNNEANSARLPFLDYFWSI